MQVFKNADYSILFHQDTETIQFNWEEGHERMSYSDFQEACCNFLGYGFEYRAKNILIDVRNFQLRLPPEFPAWQKEAHYPRYYKLGIEKVAYVMSEAALIHAKELDKEEGRFELRNFASLSSAQNWLN